MILMMLVADPPPPRGLFWSLCCPLGSRGLPTRVPARAAGVQKPRQGGLRTLRARRS